MSSTVSDHDIDNGGGPYHLVAPRDARPDHRTAKKCQVIRQKNVDSSSILLADDPLPALFGAQTETLVVNEITTQAGWRPGRVLRRWRNTAKKMEVDLALIDADGRPISIEIKAGQDCRKIFNPAM